MDQGLLSRLRAIIIGQPGVVVAYLFGSRATGRARPDSDLDLAVLWDAALDAKGRQSAEEQLRASLTDELGALGESADLLDLGRAGSTLGFRVIRDGKVVVAQDPKAKVELEARIARRYDDEAPYRELFRAAAVSAGKKLGAAAHGRS